jgi:gluconolactonase
MVSVRLNNRFYSINTEYEGYRNGSRMNGSHVYRIDPHTKEVTHVVDDFVKPDDLAFSTDKNPLYIADSAHSHSPRSIRACRTVFS